MDKHNMNKYLAPVCLALLSFVAIPRYAHAQTAVNLGTAGNFGVLAGSGITNVSAATRIIGDVGSSPTPSVTGITKSQVKGILYLSANPATANAQSDLTTAYNEVAGAPCGTDLTGVDLGGLTLVPGVYCFSSSAQLTGTLTLDAQGAPNSQWIFQIGSTLTTASSSAVIEINGGDGKSDHQQLPPWLQRERGCYVYWQIGSSATIGSGTNFEGNILALTSITLNGGIYHGKTLARNGAVTMSAQQRINGGPCPLI
jgi:type VI secretion system secreted protein VgrG